jgi:hypothetical protein
MSFRLVRFHGISNVITGEFAFRAVDNFDIEGSVHDKKEKEDTRCPLKQAIWVICIT